MIIATIFSSILVLQAQATAPKAPAAKNIPPIAATQSANIGPTVDVPAELAALVPTDAVAVIFIPNAAVAEALSTQLSSIGGPMRGMVASSKAVETLLKTNIKTTLDIPLDQPLLFWVVMPVADEDDPNQDAMGGPDIRSFVAMKIPGATNENVKSKTKRTSLALLANDMVVVGAQKSPYEAPAAGAGTCALLKQLPAGAASGRLDLATIMREQGDSLRMGASFIGMAFTQGHFQQHIEIPGVWLERGNIRGEDTRWLNSPLGLAGGKCLASLVFASGSAIDSDRTTQALQAAREVIESHPLRLQAGITCAHPQVIVLRVMSPLVEPTMDLLKKVWAVWRHTLWALPSTPPRIWSV